MNLAQIRVAGLLTFGLLLAACGDAKPTADLQISTIAVQATPQANGFTATAVDLVLIYDNSLTPEILKMSAADWFSRKDQFILDHPAGVTVRSWEIVPNQAINVSGLNGNPPQWAAIVFANYASSGAHRVRLDRPDVKLRLEDNDVVIVSTDPAAK